MILEWWPHMEEQQDRRGLGFYYHNMLWIDYFQTSGNKGDIHSIFLKTIIILRLLNETNLNPTNSLGYVKNHGRGMQITEFGKY